MTSLICRTGDRSVSSVLHDLFGVRGEAGLKGVDRVAEDRAHADIGGRCLRSAASDALVCRAVPAGVTHQRLERRHVFVTVVRVVKRGASRSPWSSRFSRVWWIRSPTRPASSMRPRWRRSVEHRDSRWRRSRSCGGENGRCGNRRVLTVSWKRRKSPPRRLPRIVRSY